jgi:hypothetical protein
MRGAASALAAWTFVTWGTRVRNIVGDDELGGGARVVALGVAGAFAVAGAAVLVAALRRSPLLGPLAVALAAATLVYWPVRLVQIATRDHSGSFVAVHVALGAVAMGLAVWTWRSRTVRRRAGVLHAG